MQKSDKSADAPRARNGRSSPRRNSRSPEPRKTVASSVGSATDSAVCKRDFDYPQPDTSPKLDAKSAILSESLDSFSWGTWGATPRMSFSRQRGKPTRQKRLITLSNLLTNSTQLVDRHYSHFSVRAASTLRVPRPSRTLAQPCTCGNTRARPRTCTRARTRSWRPRVLLVIQRRYRVTSCKAMYIQPGILVRVVEG